MDGQGESLDTPCSKNSIVGFGNDIYATKKMNNTRKNIKMANIFIISHLFDDIWLRCLKSELRAPSTFAIDSSMLSSILLKSIR
jgi:hypothetical protein